MSHKLLTLTKQVKISRNSLLNILFQQDTSATRAHQNKKTKR